MIAQEFEPSTSSEDPLARDGEDVESMDIHQVDANAQKEWPSVDDLVEAFERLGSRITNDQQAMLVLNYAAGDRGVTMWQLWQVCGNKEPNPKGGWLMYC